MKPPRSRPRCKHRILEVPLERHGAALISVAEGKTGKVQGKPGGVKAAVLPLFFPELKQSK